MSLTTPEHFKQTAAATDTLLMRRSGRRHVSCFGAARVHQTVGTINSVRNEFDDERTTSRSLR